MRKQPIDRERALALGRTAQRILHLTRRGMLEISGTAEEAELEVALVGRSGNLRAPVLLAGSTIVAGFNADVYRDALTGSSD